MSQFGYHKFRLKFLGVLLDLLLRERELLLDFTWHLVLALLTQLNKQFTVAVSVYHNQHLI